MDGLVRWVVGDARLVAHMPRGEGGRARDAGTAGREASEANGRRRAWRRLIGGSPRPGEGGPGGGAEAWRGARRRRNRRQRSLWLQRLTRAWPRGGRQAWLGGPESWAEADGDGEGAGAPLRRVLA